jgi:hypothetical protein
MPASSLFFGADNSDISQPGNRPLASTPGCS